MSEAARYPTATNRQGYKLLDVLHGDEASLLTGSRSPITAAMVIAHINGSILIGFNKFREQWELPAGRLEPPESLRECAIRECVEESCQQPTGLQFAALAQIVRPNGVVKYTAVFHATLDELRPFEETAEWSKIRLWDLHSPIGRVDTVDLEIARRCLAAA